MKQILCKIFSSSNGDILVKVKFWFNKATTYSKTHTEMKKITI